MHRNATQDAEFRACVEASDVGDGIRLRIAELLRILQHIGVAIPCFHATQDVVTCAVEDAADARDSIAGEPLLHAWDHRHATCNGRAIQQLPAVYGCEFK